LETAFPRYCYADIVEGQHRLVREALGLQRLRLILGTSMGGMHTWMWGERYPDMMDALLSIASLPERVGGQNLLWRRLLIKIVQLGQDAQRGASARQPSSLCLAWDLFELMAGSPTHLDKSIRWARRCRQTHPERCRRRAESGSGEVERRYLGVRCIARL
jgi:homoserine O-acetyltransferase/O-succinyltransferase